MKFCPKCGTQLEDNVTFCSNCGNQLDAKQPQYQPQSRRSIAAKVDFCEAIKRLFVNYVEFEGRATRSEYWWAYLFFWIVFPASLIPFIGWMIMVGMAIPMLSCGIRRLHDAGYSWVYILLSLIPFVGFIVMIVFYSKPSAPDNQWGPAAPGTVPYMNE